MIPTPIFITFDKCDSKWNLIMPNVRLSEHLSQYLWLAPSEVTINTQTSFSSVVTERITSFSSVHTERINAWFSPEQTK